ARPPAPGRGASPGDRPPRRPPGVAPLPHLAYTGRPPVGGRPGAGRPSPAVPAPHGSPREYPVLQTIALLLVIALGALSIVYGYLTVKDVLARDAGSERMQEIARAIQ